jgi:predicted porin
MKKLLLVLAATVATAVSAQTTVYGRMNATVDSTKTGSTTVDSLVNDLSHIGFRVTEDLGQGLKARAVLETAIGSQDPTGSAATQLGDRQSTVGLAHNLGSVDIGRNVHSQFLAVSNNDAFGTLYGSVAGDIHNLRGLRLSNGTFVTVTPIKNVTATYDRTYTATGTEASAYSISGKLGPVTGTVARYEAGVEKSTVAGASATFGKTAVFYSRSENESATAGQTKKGDLIGVAQTFGKFTAKASYGETDTSVKAHSVGVDYAFSKRTSAGVAYRNVNAATAAADVNQVGVGLTHLF